jgi:hypothetical protein
MAARLLVALLAALALVGGGYWWGHTATDNVWAARQARDQQAAAQALAEETARADQAAARYLTDHLDQEDRYAALDAVYQDLRRRAPLVVRPAVVARAAAPGAPAAPEAPHAGAQDMPQPSAVEPVERLTLAAVRLWNGALSGGDASAGACGAAGAPEGADAACAEDSGLTLDDAWANHTANARACAADRQRYQALIDFLNHHQQP